MNKQEMHRTPNPPHGRSVTSLVRRYPVTMCPVSAGKPTCLEEGFEGTEHNAVCLRYDIHLPPYLGHQLIDGFLDSLRHYLCSSARMSGEDGQDIHHLALHASQWPQKMMRPPQAD